MADQHTATALATAPRPTEPQARDVHGCVCSRVSQTGTSRHGRLVAVDPRPALLTQHPRRLAQGAWVVWDDDRTGTPRWEPLSTLRTEATRHVVTGHRALVEHLHALGADVPAPHPDGSADL